MGEGRVSRVYVGFRVQESVLSLVVESSRFLGGLAFVTGSGFRFLAFCVVGLRSRVLGLSGLGFCLGVGFKIPGCKGLNP